VWIFILPPNLVNAFDVAGRQPQPERDIIFDAPD
jgi:hypothetical protein